MGRCVGCTLARIDQTLDVHLAALRHKMPIAATETGGSPPVIITLRAHGFRFEPPAAQNPGFQWQAGSDSPRCHSGVKSVQGH